MKIQKVVIPALIIIGFLIFFGAISTLTNKNSKETKGETTSSSTQRSESIVRQPYVAGSFYPADSQELAARLNAFLSGVDKIEASGKLRILIVPHAGIDYSGNVAAGGFKQLEGQSYRRVILLGVSHNVYFDHIAVYPSGEWETPLGKVAVDEDLAQTLTDEPQMIKSNRQAHEQEHSLEVELIFLQQVLSDFKIVPVLIGQVADETLSSLARKVSNNLSDQTLLVVSTDLSHYPSKKVADEVDRETIEAILSGNSDIFTQSIKKNESADYPNLVTCACGAQAVRVALQSAKLLNLTDFKKIAYENSGDVTGDNERAVGYAAIGVWGKTENSGEVMLDNESQKEALAIARETLVEYISHQKIPSVIATSAVLQDNLGAFVTL
ncbi:AmmeMemoRadiSam system protein B, partial [candidate division WWE3 bacterium CG06_land_8_20_14_3_00_42_16]